MRYDDAFISIRDDLLSGYTRFVLPDRVIPWGEFFEFIAQQSPDWVQAWGMLDHNFQVGIQRAYDTDVDCEQAFGLIVTNVLYLRYLADRSNMIEQNSERLKGAPIGFPLPIHLIEAPGPVRVRPEIEYLLVIGDEWENGLRGSYIRIVDSGWISRTSMGDLTGPGSVSISGISDASKGVVEAYFGTFSKKRIDWI
jgi:hypothetical protein